MADQTTAGRGYQLPDPENTLSTDVFRIIAALIQIDVDVVALLSALAGKANTSHSHTMGDVTGLASALDGKANTSHLHALASLSDVTTTGTADGHVIKRASGSWVSATVNVSDIPGLAATLTSLQSQIDEINGGTF